MTLPDKVVIQIGGNQPPKIEKLPQELKLVAANDPVLHKPCDPAPVGKFYQAENESLIECMLKVCEVNRGYGLSANQLGVPRQLFVLYMNTPNKDFAFFNARIVEHSSDYLKMEEGCLSLPYIVHKVSRPNWVILEYQDIEGNRKSETYHGITARVICHEMDHMNGITLFDHMSPMEIRRAKERQVKNMKKFRQR